MREPDDFTALYLRLRVEEQLRWYRAKARLLAGRHRMLLMVLYGLLTLTALVYLLAATISMPQLFWRVSGATLPVASLLLASTIAFSAIGQRSRQYHLMVRALETAHTEGETLQRDSATDEAEIARWVERVEDLIQTGDDAAGRLDDLSPDGDFGRTPAGDA